MDKPTLKKRQSTVPVPLPDLGGGSRDVGKDDLDEHPAGQVRHSRTKQLLRMLLLAGYFWTCSISIVLTQLLGAPLYYINRDWYYAYMAKTKESFGLTMIFMTDWWASTVVRISGDKSVAGQIKRTARGGAEFRFPERMVMMANHNIYTDWFYLWWIGYINNPKMHGHIYIVLKESLKYIPVLGQGMMFFGFIFMSRKWANDKDRMAYRLNKLKTQHSGPSSDARGLDPMWFMIFPEGTNVSFNGRQKSAAWAEKTGIKDMQHQLLPRSAGLFFCLNELKGTVEDVYDCTIAYEGIPRGKFGQDYFTLRSTFLEGRPPKSVNMYWRRIPISSIPLDDHEKFDKWLLEQWRLKDDLIEQYVSTGRFPPLESLEEKGSSSKVVFQDGNRGGFIETSMKLNHDWELGQVFVVLATLGLVTNLVVKSWRTVVKAGNGLRTRRIKLT